MVQSDHVLGYAVHPAFLEMRNLLNVLLGDVLMLEPELRDRPRGEEPALSATRRRLERTSLGLTRHLLALEATLVQGDAPADLDQAAEAADSLARHVTRDVGGVRWRLGGLPALISGTRPAAVVGIAAGLRLLAEGLPAGATRGIDAMLRLRPGSAELALSAPDASAAIYRGAGDELRACTPCEAGFSVAGDERGLRLTWRRAAARAAF